MDDQRFSEEENAGSATGMAGRMCRIWEAALGVSPIRLDDDYFALGGDSLQAIEILTEVREVFGARLPMSSLYDAPTPAQLAILAYEGVAPDSRPMFPLSREGEGPPLFLLPGAGANAFVFDGLLRAADLGRPVYGLRLPFVAPEKAPLSSLAEVAGVLVEHLVAVEPVGPYYLGGYSFGGRLAFEIARRLEETGRRVAFLGLIDTYGPGYPPPLPPWRRVLSHLRAATHPDRAERRRYRQERMQRLGGRVKGLTKRLVVSSCPDRFLVPDYIRDDFRYHRWLSHHYEPAHYSGRLTLFRASDVPEVVGTDFSDPYLGWGRWVAGGIEVRPVPGDHISLLEEPQVRALGLSLRACLAG
jgi:thioesterase domain-containing protein/acyl carrier protein